METMQYLRHLFPSVSFFSRFSTELAWHLQIAISFVRRQVGPVASGGSHSWALNVLDCFLLMLLVFFFFPYIQITQLKIDNNPFAKGFRDTGAGKREKK